MTTHTAVDNGASAVTGTLIPERRQQRLHGDGAWHDKNHVVHGPLDALTCTVSYSTLSTSQPTLLHSIVVSAACQARGVVRLLLEGKLGVEQDHSLSRLLQKDDTKQANLITKQHNIPAVKIDLFLPLSRLVACLERCLQDRISLCMLHHPSVFRTSISLAWCSGRGVKSSPAPTNQLPRRTYCMPWRQPGVGR